MYSVSSSLIFKGLQKIASDGALVCTPAFSEEESKQNKLLL
jgi:hypothetical protein